MTTAARTTREIIRIGDEKCTGCGECVPNCPEGALQIIDGKARLMSDLFCDGLGACIGHCPEGAIEVEEREAEPYDERRVMESIVPHGPNTIRAHLEHLKGHGADAYHAEAVAFLKECGMEIPAGEPVTGCPGCRVMDLGVEDAAPEAAAQEEEAPVGSRPSRLRQWPVQLKLVPVTAPYLRGADLVISADCVPFAYADFHEEILKGKVLLVGCPKLDDVGLYEEKLKRIFAENDVRSVTCVHMTVPCCFGLVVLVKEAIAASGKDVPFTDVTVSVEGEIVAPDAPDAPEASAAKGGAVAVVERCPGQDARFLKPDDVRDEVCPACGAAVEFFKNDRSRKCPDCGTRFRNPRLDIGCAEWCPYAAECVDFEPEESADGQGTT